MALSQVVFKKFSTDGKMTCSELKEMLAAQGYTTVDDEGVQPVSEDEVDAAFLRLDTDGSGFIEYPEFQKWWRTEYEYLCGPAEQENECKTRVSRRRTKTLKFESEIEKNEVAEAKMEFAQVSSCNETMDKARFHKLCYRNGYYLTLTELDDAFDQLDKDGSGVIEFCEFLRWWRDNDRFAHLPLDEDEETRTWAWEVSEYFGGYDTEFRGSLTMDEFTSMFNDGFSETCACSLDDAVAQVDLNHDGRISFNEFMLWYSKTA